MKPRISKEAVTSIEELIDRLRADNEAFYARYPGEPRHVLEEAYDEIRWELLKHTALTSAARAGE